MLEVLLRGSFNDALFLPNVLLWVHTCDDTFASVKDCIFVKIKKKARSELDVSHKLVKKNLPSLVVHFGQAQVRLNYVYSTILSKTQPP